MAVSDRWHAAHPKPDDPAWLAEHPPCREHSRGRAKLYESKDHGTGDRWQVRWRDEHGNQRSANRPKKDGKDAAVHADALDAKIQAELNAGTYVDPAAGARKFRDYAEEIVKNRAIDEGTRGRMRSQLARHVYPVIGETELRTLAKRPSMIQALVKSIERAGLDPSTIKVLMAHVSMVFVCAMDDGLVTRNPCKASSVVLPTIHRKKVVPWTAGQVTGTRAALPGRFAALVDVGAGLGLRQGEIFGLSPDDVEWLSPEPFVRVDRQVKVLRGGLAVDLPKGRKTRTVPLPESVQVALAEHMRLFPPVTVRLPWGGRDGAPTTVRLFFSGEDGKPVHRVKFNPDVWKPALVEAGIEPARANGMHALRHYFASVLLTEGESIQAVSAWLGHHDPTVTLKIYAHLMPKSETRMRTILDRAMTTNEQPQERTGHGRD